MPSLPGSSSDDTGSDNTPVPDSINFYNNVSSESDDDLTLSSVKSMVHSVRVGSKIMKNLMIDCLWVQSRSYLDQGRYITVLTMRMGTMKL